VARLSLFLFGSYQILLDKKDLTRSLPVKGRALLAYLVRERSPQRRDKLAGLLWPDCSEAQAHHNLSQTVYILRRVLALQAEKPEWLQLDAQEIELNSRADVWMDVAEFSGLWEACECHSHPKMTACPECFERLQRAAALYRGAFLADFSLPYIGE
jgi:DNA-binding SARP family transcriptional activator